MSAGDFESDWRLSEGCEVRTTEFMELLGPRQSRLYGYLFALVADPEVASDLFQQTVMILWQKFDEFQPNTNFTAWAFKTAQLEVLRYRRSAGRARLLFSDELVAQIADVQSDGDDPSLIDQRFEFLQECLRMLNGKDRTLVEKCYYKGVRIQSVAATLGRSSQSVCNSLRRIRRALLDCVDRKQAQFERA